jgi:hypothetical protein
MMVNRKASAGDLASYAAMMMSYARSEFMRADPGMTAAEVNDILLQASWEADAILRSQFTNG